MTTNGADLPAPLGLLAELTHRCPLGCPYCSNPLALDKRDERLSYRIVENIGVAALPLFEARMSERIDKYERTRVLATLSNIRSPRVAKILAEYAEVKPYVEIVRTYFALHRDLLDQMLADPELRYYHDDLVVLKEAS